MDTPLILGHRGASWAHPENTLEAFAAALAEGAEGVELDARRCATGELVVCHDADLARVAGARARVRACSAWALSRYDLGGGARVPTLAAVLAAMGDRLVNIELKADDDDPVALARATAALLATPRFQTSRVLVSSFEPATLVALRACAPGVRRGLLVPSEPLAAADVLARARDVRPHAVHPHHALCTAERVAAWRALGLVVYAWTVDAAAEVVRLARAGVTGVITNRPGAARAALAAAVDDG